MHQGTFFAHLVQKALTSLVKELSMSESESQLHATPTVAMFSPYVHVERKKKVFLPSQMVWIFSRMAQ